MNKSERFKVVLPVLSLIVALLWIPGGQKPMVRASPVAPASGAGWDGLGVSAPTVLLDEGTYRMWYQGRSLTFYGGWALGYAASPDGLAWTKHAGNPILEPAESGAWDSAYRGQVAVINDGGTYKMWYSGGSSSGAWQVGYATSTDGLEWQIYPGNPVLSAGGPGSWDELECDGPAVIKDGATYKMWYFGCNADYTVCSIGYATSPDGINWTKHAGNPVLEATPGQWDASGLAWPRVIKRDATYEMWYHSGSKIGRATSPDGINWNKYAGNPVLSQGWSGAGVSGPATILLDGATYKMWFRSGSAATTGIGYAESTDGITWTQPVSNPLLQRGQTGVIINADYDYDGVEALTLGNTALTITVGRAGTVKATISGVTDAGGRYRSRDYNADWVPVRPDILPGDTVSAAAGSYSTVIETVGEIDAHVFADTDLVEGTIDAPWFASGLLSVLCEVYVEPSQSYLDRDVPADGGAFRCDFTGLADIVGGQGGKVGYLEPDGDMVSASFTAPYMEVYYGIRDGAGGIYPPGHTFWIKVTDAAGATKATAETTSTAEGWWGYGFRPTWSGGDCCAWFPAEPDIQPGDRVSFQSDDGYKNEIRVGGIYGTVDLQHDSVTGPIHATWLEQTLEVWCGPPSMFPPEWRQSSAEPDGSVPYFCQWLAGDPYPLDIQPDDELMIRYFEPDHDEVIRMMRASEGARLPRAIYLPLVLKG